MINTATLTKEKWDKFPDSKKDELLKWKTTLSEEILDSCAHSENRSIRYSLAANYKLSEKAFQKLLEDDEHQIILAMLKNHHLSTDMISSILNKTRDVGIMAQVCDHPNATPEMIEKIVKNPLCRLDALRSNHATPELLAEYLDSDEPGVARSIASNVNATPQILDFLSTHKDYRVRFSVAKNKSTPSFINERLINDKHETVVRHAIVNGNLNENICEKIYSHSSEMTRTEFALRRDLSENIFERLTQDECIDVRIAIAKNPSLTMKCAQILIEDRSPRVKLALLKAFDLDFDSLFKTMLLDKNMSVSETAYRKLSAIGDDVWLERIGNTISLSKPLYGSDLPIGDILSNKGMHDFIEHLTALELRKKLSSHTAMADLKSSSVRRSI
ncbi:hypothetical protein ACEUAI_13135 [Aeromonas veronii]